MRDGCRELDTQAGKVPLPHAPPTSPPETASKKTRGLWRVARALFGVRLGLNALWSYVFFGRRELGWALVEILFLWAAIAATVRAFFRISRTAGLLLVPYLLWTSSATLLNHVIWRLNR